MNATERMAFARWAGNRDEFLQLARSEAGGKISTIVEGLADSSAFGSFTLLEAQIIKQGLIPGARQWQAAIQELAPRWQRAAVQAGDVQNDELVEPARRLIMLRFFLTCVVGLLVVAGSLAVSLLFARRLAQELRDLQASAQRLAHERLPAVVARLRRGEKVDVDAEAPPPEPGRTTEITLVAAAFDAVQRTAVSTAVGEAELRAGINRVFINLSWRSQSLLHRQLRLLDQMERRASSPEELDDLFRLDHLTTRMRPARRGPGDPLRVADRPRLGPSGRRRGRGARRDRRGRGLHPGRGDRRVVDRGHRRRGRRRHPPARRADRERRGVLAAATEVTVKVETVANGLAVEVVDRGVGLEPDELEELNRRLASAVEFDLADTERLGLFVVARLAARHRIQVSLQPSAYGGTTAIVLIPHALVVLDDEWHMARGLGPARPRPVASAASAAAPPARLDRPVRPALHGRVVQGPPTGGEPEAVAEDSEITGPAPAPRPAAPHGAPAARAGGGTAPRARRGRRPRRLRRLRRAEPGAQPRPDGLATVGMAARQGHRRRTGRS
ncbi:ATP-binding protein [Actinomadura madurae]|uniref:ATP-binding protein n=1 Tax=Actinomadura madurae TaxID=1993 RepID=UPI0020D250D8|nr:ATP-binding protein [Actinomadura madurae]MCQ0010807.1 ATP-binding protein [Actinomadura madurae]